MIVDTSLAQSTDINSSSLQHLPFPKKNITSGKKIFLIIGVLLMIIAISIALFLINNLPAIQKIHKLEFYDGTTNKVKATLLIKDPQDNFRMIQGLRNTPTISSEFGILFRFNHLSKSPSWMRDMLFPIDIIWLKDNTVVDTKENLKIPFPGQPLESLRQYRPKIMNNSSLEVKAGFVNEFKISKGDYVKEYELK